MESATARRGIKRKLLSISRKGEGKKTIKWGKRGEGVMHSNRQPYPYIAWVRLFISTSPGPGGKSMAHSTDLRSSQRCAKSSVL
jgi:hypothetical protein